MMKYLTVCLALTSSILPVSLMANSLDQGMGIATEIQEEGATSQKKVDDMALQTEKMLEEYKRLMTDVDYKSQRLEELKQLKIEQEKRIVQLQSELESIEYTQRRITPLLRSMVDALEQFVVLDLPFHQSERIAEILALRSRVNGGELSVSEKFRLVMEAFQIELAYGNSLESYQEAITQKGESVTVQLLRVGRTALYYQTLDGESSAIWAKDEKRWQPLPASYNAVIARGLKVAADQLAPELLSLPVAGVGTGGKP